MASDVTDSRPLYRPGARVAAAYFLACAGRITRLLDEDIGPSIAFLGVSWANVAHLAAGADAPPVPDEARAPVTVYRLADNLGMPYETARRYATRLVEAGLCTRSEAGVVIPEAVLTRPEFRALVLETWEATTALRNDLLALGVALPEPADPPTDEDRRWVARLSTDYFLRYLGYVTEGLQADPITALVFLSVYDANARPVRDQPEISLTLPAPDAVRPDALREPASIYRVAKTLRLPYETARRHARRLIKDGWCETAPDGGLIVPGASLLRPVMAQAAELSWRAALQFQARAAERGLGAAP
jgi:hypothetical protein